MQTQRGTGGRPRGQAIVEAAVVLVTFIALLAGLIDLGRMFMTMQALQNGVREGVRFGVTGRKLSGLDRVTSIRQTVVDASRQGVDPADVLIESIRGGTKTTGAGTANDILVVSVTHPVRVYSPWLAPLMGGTYTARAQAALKNEDFDDASVPTVTTTTTTTITTTTNTTTTTRGSTTSTRASTTTTSSGVAGSSSTRASTTTTTTRRSTTTSTRGAGTTTTTRRSTTSTTTRPGGTTTTRGSTTTTRASTTTTRTTGATTTRPSTTTTTRATTTTMTFPLG